MLQFISFDLGCGVALTPLIIVKGHGHLLIESAQHSLTITPF